MTRILYVGGYDFAAMEWERSGETAHDAWERAMAVGGTVAVDPDGVTAGTMTAYEFGEIDPAFLEVIESQTDYDVLKDSKFYLVESSEERRSA